MVVIQKEKIIQVTSHCTCGVQQGRQVPVIPGREICRQQAHLDLVGNTQLTLYFFPGGSGILEVCNIIDQFILHMRESVCELRYLVFRSEDRKCRTEIPLPYPVGRIHKPADGTNEFAGDKDSEQDHCSQADQEYGDEVVKELI